MRKGIKVKRTFKFVSSRGAKVKVILGGKDTNNIYSVIVSVYVNRKNIADNVEAYISCLVGRKGAFMIFTSKKNKKEDRETAICLNDCPKLLKYLFVIGKNRRVLEEYTDGNNVNA